ncbi:MAG: hypothetical protein IPG63_17945 [Xanthomonadales bacterium]|nr:hypothetical protein [Xanthomonadales bacterium]
MDRHLLATLVLTPFYGAIVARHPRRVFIPVTYAFFAIGMVAFSPLLRTDAPGTLLAAGFYIWVSVFNLFVVAVFWSFMADLFTDEQGAPPVRADRHWRHHRCDRRADGGEGTGRAGRCRRADVDVGAGAVCGLAVRAGTDALGEAARAARRASPSSRSAGAVVGCGAGTA